MKKIILAMISSLLIFNLGCTLRHLQHPSRSSDAQMSKMIGENVIPKSYDLNLLMEPEAEYFNGKVEIAVEILKPVRSFWIHGQDLNVFSTQILRGSKTWGGIYEQVDQEGLAKITFGDVIMPGTYTLTLVYQGKYQDDLSGIYKVKQQSEEYLFTQFEPLSARKMLPCFDEPRFKAPFVVTVTTDPKNHVIANAPIFKSYLHNDKMVNRFEVTESLSTYLLALAVGPFDIVEGPTLPANKLRARPIPVRGIAVKGKGLELSYALKNTPAILEKLETYFGTSYPYAKLDILAVPDFSAGAMENAGAITFREWYLLIDEKTATVEQLKGFDLVMAHELAHQWFGNLVTMPWWDDLWLNEAFATWLSFQIIDEIKPSWNVLSQLLARSHDAMAADSLQSVRKIREPIKTNHDIHNAFDAITYSKGAAVISMMENFLGRDQFRKAVQYHINKFAQKTATSEDFLRSLSKFSKVDTTPLVGSFLNQPGIPLLSMATTCEQGQVRVKVSQQRSLPLGSKASKDVTWQVPLCLGVEQNGQLQKQCFLLDKPEQEFTLSTSTCPLAIVPNFAGLGYYRFRLPQKDWEKLIGLPNTMLSEQDKLAIADSLKAELAAGTLNFGFVVGKIQTLVNDSSPWLAQAFMDLILKAKDFYTTPKNRSLLVNYAQKTLLSVQKNLAEKTTLSADEKSLQRKVTWFLSQVARHQPTRDYLKAMGTQYLSGLSHHSGVEQATELNENLLDEAVAVVMQDQTNKFLNETAESLAEEDDIIVRNRLLYGLALSRQGAQAEDVRGLFFNPHLRKNELMPFWNNHLQNRNNQPFTWRFVQDNFGKIKTYLPPSRMGNMPTLANGLCSEDDAQSVTTFFEKDIHHYEGGPRKLAEVSESISLCAAQKEQTTQGVSEFLENSAAQVGDASGE